MFTFIRRVKGLEGGSKGKGGCVLVDCVYLGDAGRHRSIWMCYVVVDRTGGRRFHRKVSVVCQ
jgi:hypothetical protein